MQTLISGIKTTLSNIQNNKQTFFLSVATITISIIILGLFLMFFININGFLYKWNKQVELIAYLNDDITNSQKEKLVNIISKFQNVETYLEISREVAWTEFQSNISKNLKPLLDLDFNPLPASYKIKFHDVGNR